MKSLKQVLKTTIKRKKVFGIQCAIFDQGETKTITAFTTKINDICGILKEFKGYVLIKFEIHTVSHKPHTHLLLRKLQNMQRFS